MIAPIDLGPALLSLSARLGGPLLALDSSVSRGSICAVGLVPGRVDELSLDPAAPSEALATALAGLLADSGTPASRLAAIAVGLGPGSFTGLRVGLATIKGLAMGTGVRVVGVSSLALVAAGSGTGLVAPVLDARRGDVFCALYEVGEDGVPRPRLDDGVMPEAEFARRLAQAEARQVRVVGASLELVPALAGAGHTIISDAAPRAAAALLLATPRFVAGEGDALATLVPRYLRVSEAERQAGLPDR